MFSHPQQGAAPDEVLRLRQEAGKWLRSKRELAGLSQREMAKAVGQEYYSIISQIESGRGRIPPVQMQAWARALKVAPRDFATQLMRYYDPLTYEMIFGGAEAEPHDKTPRTRIETLEERVSRLERISSRA